MHVDDGEMKVKIQVPFKINNFKDIKFGGNRLKNNFGSNFEKQKDSQDLKIDIK